MVCETEESSNTLNRVPNLGREELITGIEEIAENPYISLVGKGKGMAEPCETEDWGSEDDDDDDVHEDEEEVEEEEEEEEEDEEEEQETEEEQVEQQGQPIEQVICNRGIAINGLDDMGYVNFKELTVDDLVKYHFPDREIAFMFYSWFSRMHGFAARKCRLFKSKRGDVLQQTFVCYREGKKKETIEVGQKRRRFPKKDSRCGCEAQLQVHIDGIRWYVKSVSNVYNHTLVDLSMVGLVPSHRRMNEVDITQMNYFNKVGVSTAQAYGVFASQMGGYVNVPFGKQNMYNEKEKQRKNDIVDARGVLSLLCGLKQKDPGLIWQHTTDSEGRLEKLFWCDGVSKANYSVFGDVLAFDATYKKNKYKRPLVVFSGVNHHNHTIIFASALVSNESEDTYVWLLQNFLDAMMGKAPVSVITDGHVPMKNAIKKVLPTTHHRLCAWHLLRNANSNVADPNFIPKLTVCMLWDLEIGDFENKWAEMVADCDCEENEWVMDLYERKKVWAAAHLRGEFFAGMRTTSSVEGLHAQVGKHVNSWNNLTDFMLNFNRYLSFQRQRELEADFSSIQGEHVLQTQLRKLERSASNYYTNNIFKLVCRSLQCAVVLRVNLYKKTSTCSIYFVSRYASSGRRWTVSFWESSSHFKCSCMRRESHGLPCDHIFALLAFLDVVEIPRSLVVDRWTKTAKDGLGPVGDQSSAWDPLSVCRFVALRESCRRLCKVACLTPTTFSEINTLVLSEAKKLEPMTQNTQATTMPTINNEDRYLRNPPMPSKRGHAIGTSRGRGRGRGRCSIHCGICGVVEHNRQSCTRHTQ